MIRLRKALHNVRAWLIERQGRPHIDLAEAQYLFHASVRLGRAIEAARADGVITAEELAELAPLAAEIGVDLDEALGD